MRYKKLAMCLGFWSKGMCRVVGIMCICACYAFGLEVIEFRIYQKQLLDSVRYLVSEKYDGVRAVWDSKHLQTKRGNLISAPQCFLQQLPPFGLDGELWIGYGKFEEIQGLVNTKDSICEQWASVQYLIFDSPSCGIKGGDCTLSERLEEVRKFIDTHKPPNIHLITQHTIQLQDKATFDTYVHTMLKEVLGRGGEGLIIRPDELRYRAGRAKNAFKLKAHTDSECKVVGYTQGNGRLHGKIGALVCEQILQSNADTPLPKAWHNKRITFKIGSGLTDTLRTNPPKIGAIITYQYTGFSKNGIPKHTRFLRIYDE